MRYFNEIITILNIFLMFLTPIMVLIIKKQLSRKRKILIASTLSVIPALFYVYYLKNPSNYKIDEYHRFKVGVKRWGEAYLKDFHTLEGHELYKEKFGSINKICIQDFNKRFLIGTSWLDRSEKAKFMNIYSKVLTKAPSSCKAFVDSKIFFNKYFFENFKRLEKNDQEILFRITAQSIVQYYVILTKEFDKDETKLMEQVRAEWLTGRKTIEPSMSSKDSRETCRDSVIKMSTILEKDIPDQNSALDQIAAESWEALEVNLNTFQKDC